MSSQLAGSVKDFILPGEVLEYIRFSMSQEVLLNMLRISQDKSAEVIVGEDATAVAVSKVKLTEVSRCTSETC